MNVHDSEKIAGIFSETGYQEGNGLRDADIVVLNTCNIRHKAEQKFYSELGRLRSIKEINPHLKVAVAGCIAKQRGEKIFKRFPYVDFIFGPNNIDSIQDWIKDNRQNTDNPPILPLSKGGKGKFKTVALNDNPEYHTKILPVKREGRVKAWVSIMYGCDNFCAYCVVPYTRGRERSRPSRDIYNEVESLAHQGFKEVTLLGQNVNSYGKKLNEGIDFPDLLIRIHDIKGIERIRFVTSHPGDFSERLIKVMKDLPGVCEHLHLPVQSGSDKVLRLMNRRYKYEDYKRKIDMLRNVIPDIAITTDIIVGFPGETHEDFRLTINAQKEIEYDGIYAFKYSKRPDTKALGLPNHVDERIKSERLTKVLSLQEIITYKKNKNLEGRIYEVLVEGVSETDINKLTGRTRTNKIVNFHGDETDIGKLVNIKILEARQHSLYGETIT